jgi:divalent metal cation (Fe/Co/Zn/Cd) transporter
LGSRTGCWLQGDLGLLLPLSLALLIGVGAFALFGWWWADAIGALAMLPVIVWQGWETLVEATEMDNST